MCGRYTLLAEEVEILKEFGLDHKIPNYEPRYNIAPGQKVLAIIHDGKEKRAGFLKWGLVPFWAKDPKIGYKVINARSETAHEKPSFKQLMAKRRCLIVADSFYEWQRTDEGKQAKRISPKDRKLFAFAGLWDKWGKDEEDMFTCTILTKEANEFMSPIHDRMPVILPHEKQEEWIEPVKWGADEAAGFISQLKTDELDAYDVSDIVNSPKNDDPECIKPIA
ncbi:Putative SOS response-associated peptidase YedK [Thalassobacillus cyri]|uniref:Abasic site processing protein n=1 Tax=Thalassobacillus cyri TaxID=571932 RepID=A0A1H3Z1A8_9BACI|nr:SOS response-associated peptidase [Thalassobacillus cyri]SEA17529.1 Putative SOS response-associated peptidase YedK [Thalassobacillus cyri]